MNNKELPRYYAYHFKNPEEKYEMFLSTFENPDLAPKNSKGSFKYTPQLQEHQKNQKPFDTDLSKFALLRDKLTQPIKKYTFSGLTKGPKNFKNSENSSFTNPPSSEVKAMADISRQSVTTQPFKAVIENEESVFQDRETKNELSTQCSVDKKSVVQCKVIELSQKIVKVSEENAELKMRNEEYKKRLQLLENANDQLSLELKNAKERALKQEKNIEQLNRQIVVFKEEIARLEENAQLLKKPKYTMNIFANVIQEKVQSQVEEKQVQSSEIKQQKSTQEEVLWIEGYKEIVSLFGFGINQPDCHRLLVDHIRQTQKLFQDLTVKAIKVTSLQKQKSKLVHALKKNESELNRLCHDNSFLQNQLQRNLHLIGEYTEQISVLHLKQLQLKLSAKYAEK